MSWERKCTITQIWYRQYIVILIVRFFHDFRKSGPVFLAHSAEHLQMTWKFNAPFCRPRVGTNFLADIHGCTGVIPIGEAPNGFELASLEKLAETKSTKLCEYSVWLGWVGLVEEGFWEGWVDWYLSANWWGSMTKFSLDLCCDGNVVDFNFAFMTPKMHLEGILNNKKTQNTTFVNHWSRWLPSQSLTAGSPENFNTKRE